MSATHPVMLAVASITLGSAVLPSSLRAQAIPEVDFPKPASTLKESLKSVKSMLELKDGRVMIMDAGAKKLLVADFASGKIEERMNDGPEENEFRGIGELWSWSGDSVVTIDPVKSVLYFFGPDGKFARAQGFGGPPGGAGRGASMAVGGGGAPPAVTRGPRLPELRTLIGTDRVIGVGFPPRPTAPLPPASAPPRLPYPVIRMILGRFRFDTVAQLMPAQAPRVSATSTTGTFTVHVSSAPLQHVDVWAAYRDGTVVIARAATYRLEWFAMDGTHTTSEPLSFEQIAVTNADKKHVMEEYKKIGAAALAVLPTRTSILAVDYNEPPTWPTTHPPFRSDITPLIDPKDRLWLATRCTKDEQALCYDVISREGTRVTRFKLPPKLRVIGFGKDVIYTINEQKSDKDVLQKHALN